MPIFEDDNVDRNGQPIVRPPTPPSPPHDPEYLYGLALKGLVLSSANQVVSEGLLCNGKQNGGRNGGEKRRSAMLDEPQTLKQQISSSQGGEDDSRLLAASDGTEPHGSDPRLRKASNEKATSLQENLVSRKFSMDRIGSLAVSPDFSSTATLPPTLSRRVDSSAVDAVNGPPSSLLPVNQGRILLTKSPLPGDASRRISQDRSYEARRPRNLTIEMSPEKGITERATSLGRPPTSRTLSTPASMKSPSSTNFQDHHKARTISRGEQNRPRPFSSPRHLPPSPVPTSIPMPPLSLSTYLQLELAAQRPPQVYIHRSASTDFPYESSGVKIERLLNFLFLPHQLEGVLWFGVLACLDSWLYVFTILPLRMVKSIYLLCQSWARNIVNELRFVTAFTYSGSRRLWKRRRTSGQFIVDTTSGMSPEAQTSQEVNTRTKTRVGRHHRRNKTVPSALTPVHKADLLRGLLIIATCAILLQLDASRMYHWVRGQAAIKLYVIYNLLEVCDRLLSAIGQDVLECLFSSEALERKPNGHSRVLRPFWLFVLALIYCVIHATALFYQVVTLNVAVNSYSNALVTLLMSNQFVEIKGTVFKKFDKESLFQVTLADIVERFQLWHMLVIIASRNIVETGGLSLGIPDLLSPAATATASITPNTTQAVPPLTASSILPRSFMIVPSLFSSFSSYVPAMSHVLGPFVIVLGSEMLIDWLKHAYVGKFNNTKPAIYGRFLDILAKDYYTNAFGNQNLLKRMGLPVLPLSCLMIRAGFQTYQVLMASWVPAPLNSNAATLASIQRQYSTTRAQPTSTAGMIVRKMDDLFNKMPAPVLSAQFSVYLTTTLVLLLMFLVLLAIKLILGMGLLAFSRARYRAMKERERSNYQHPTPYIEGAQRVGGWGAIEVDDGKRRIIYEDDPAGFQAFKAREAKDKARKKQEEESGFGTEGLEKVQRYEMAAKRIW